MNPEDLSLVPKGEETPLGEVPTQDPQVVDALLGEAKNYELEPQDPGTSLERPSTSKPFDWTGANVDLTPKREDR